MKFRIYRGWTRNLLSMREVFSRKLVVEDEVLFSDAGITVNVTLVAYSGTDTTTVEFVTYRHGDPYREVRPEVPTVPLLAAADIGEDALVARLFDIWRYHEGE